MHAWHRWWLLLAGAFASCSPHLVDVESMRRPPVRDVRYATTDNFTRTKLYPLPKVFLHPDTARALEAVQADLAVHGLGLKIFDGYRPLSVQWKMWNLIHDDRYVSNPAVNRGRHTRGTAVDVTLVDRQGRELPMGTAFDDFTDRAHPDYPALPETVKRNRQLLAGVMSRHDFEAYPYEWWHFDLKGWKGYPVLDIGIDRLAVQ
ncbi:MAG: M15 family metallopeptidase [Luteolibacter sp.]